MIGYAKPTCILFPLLSPFWRHSYDQGIEPYGGNLYRRHVHRAPTGDLWCCAHGWTCGNDGVGHATPPVLKHPRWMICKWCAFDDPVAYLRWRFRWSVANGATIQS